MTARSWHYFLFGAWVLALASTPLWGGNYVIRLAITIAMYSALTLSWNFIGGFTGYPSFSTAAFFGLGSYVGALSQNAGAPMLVAWLAATLFVALFTAGLGGIILRLRGHYFAIGSIGIVEVTRLVIASWGKSLGSQRPLLALRRGNRPEVRRLLEGLNDEDFGRYKM